MRVVRPWCLLYRLLLSVFHVTRKKEYTSICAATATLITLNPPTLVSMKTVKTSLPPQQPTDFSPGVGSIPCRFFQIGQCAKVRVCLLRRRILANVWNSASFLLHKTLKGTKCPFMHKKTAPHFTPQSCKFFQTGACKYGDRYGNLS